MRSLQILLIATLSCLLPACNDPDIPVSNETSLLDQHRDENFGQPAYHHTEKIIGFGPRPVGSPALDNVRSYIRKELNKHGWSCTEQAFTKRTPHGEKTFVNLVARHSRGDDEAAWKRSIKGILGAHIDSKILPNFVGADDAASAVGAILTIASFLHQHHPDAADELELVFFDGEEAFATFIEPGIDGLYGSFHYARSIQSYTAQKKAPYQQLPRYAIVLDMIGHKNLKIKIPSDTPAMLRTHYNSARRKLGTASHFLFADTPIIDDHLPLQNIARIPSIDIIGDFGGDDWWHTKHDNLELISSDSLQKSIHLTLEMISSLR